MKGILFKPEMVQAILSGQKTMTRRVLKVQPKRIDNLYADGTVDCERLFRNGKRMIKAKYLPGEIIYVKECWGIGLDGSVIYKADTVNTSDIKWHSPMFMPEKRSRIKLQITSINVQRLQDITLEDALKEGCELYDSFQVSGDICAFSALWDSINKPPYDWASNPWTFVYEFKVIQGGKQ